MNLDQQIQILIDDAANYGVSETVMELVVAPIFQLFCTQLKHTEYYVIRTLNDDWVLTTLSSNSQSEVEKTVIYAFSTLKDAARFQGTSNPDILAISIPVIDILLQIFTLQQIDSIIFMETPGDLNNGIEVDRNSLQNLIEVQIQHLDTLSQQKSTQIPPDIA